MKTKQYREKQVGKIKIDGYKLAQNEVDYYKVGIKFWDYENHSTNHLSITNKEFNQIKEILFKNNQ
tara:strand:- start:833 stop:1030 length:198 start_codon:yes stop_codon:yes gene_type:complete